MGKKVFVSYSHRQSKWVFDRLVPCLLAGGTEVLIDEDRLRVGPKVIGQMDALQDQADASLLVFTEEYLASAYCRHEMDRAIGRDAFIPLQLGDCTLPDPVPDHLYADLRNGADAAQWRKLLEACGADLGCDAPHWLEARDEARRYLLRGDSVNLVVRGRPKWRELIAQLKAEVPTLERINLDDGATVDRPGLVREILRTHGDTRAVPDEPRDLGTLSEFLKQRRPLLAFLRFDHVRHRPYQVDFFANLRYHLEERNLTMLIESSAPFASLLPDGHAMSSLTSIKKIELRGR